MSAPPVTPRQSRDPLLRSVWPVMAALAAVVALSELTAIDLWVQDRCFDFTAMRWAVDENARLPKAWFYTGPKVVLIAFGLACIGLLVGPERWRQRLGLGERRRELAAVVATLALGPFLIGEAKARTNLFCPYEITRYGGDVPYVRLFEPFPKDQRPGRRGVCFPAGHASGGFALMALAGLATTRRGRLRGLAIGLAFGTWMGAYQMLKGAHYLSHTLITALLMWLLFLGCRSLLQRIRRPGNRLPPSRSLG